MSEETPTVVVTDADSAATEKAQRKAEARALAATLRAGAVAGLENELAYLERQPVKNTARVADVKAQLDLYSKEPKAPKIETAAATAPVVASAPAVPAAPAAPVPAAKKVAAKRAPAKKG